MSNDLSLFAGTDLAARIERAERSLMAEGAQGAARRDPRERVLRQPIGSGLAVWAGAYSPLDKVVGVGMGDEFDDAALEAVEKAYAERGAPVQFEVSTLADPGVVDRLTRRGYVLTGFENVLGLPLAPGRAAQPADGVEVRAVAPDEFDRWLDIFIDGFAVPDTQGAGSDEAFPREVLAHAMRDMAGASGFSGSIAWLDGAAAGAASLRLHDGVAQLCGAATLPEFRRRGVQASLLSTRLAAAAAAGCDLAVVTTLPGSKSQQNVQRMGFQLLYARAILVDSASAQR
ncbi:putative acyltransferase [Nocardia brasiliensis ATCC 700358]|uniref:Putative acyltransferase n=1 Tax=Nocardia brasiliensis (strain ATCC 700358 / HUJEG-1) TaxID=1133849 RepID=K0F7Q2_NOCB7|nr:GNAT family N-acetyltransferase [Nocardia brasiliensis]AFU05395.1 putative acyltransferase [Nocardia brasiliensis ATCC 700358]